MKTEAKKALSTLVFSIPFVSGSSFLYSIEDRFSLVFLLLFIYFYSPFFLSFVSLARFNSRSALAFLTPSLHDQTAAFVEQPTHAAPWHRANFQGWSRLFKDLPG